MVDSSGSKLPCLIADSAAFLRNVDLQNISDHIFTIKEVVGEIRDTATKQRLAVLPYELDFRTPSAESLQFVIEFAKKTGDYKALSAVDLRVLALTYQLEKEFCNVDHINLEPSKKTAVVHKAKVYSDKEIAGFYFEPKGEVVESGVEIANTNSDVSKVVNEKDEIVNIVSGVCIQVDDGDDDNGDDNDDDHRHQDECNVNTNIVNDVSNQNGEVFHGVNGYDKDNIDKENGVDGDDDGDDDSEYDGDNDDDDDDDDDECGWITPENIQKVKQSFGAGEEIKIEDGNVKCACLTTDFAMQNVLIQMGLHVLSVQGMLIRQARSYVQKCFGCYKETHDMVRLFCPSCGNKTLKKVAVTIGDDGTMQYHYPKRNRNPNIRGTKFSIPAPKGGRVVDAVLLAEDQPIGRNRMPRSRDNANPLDPDYSARANPFSVKDVNSRAFNLGIHVKQKQARNPNETKKKKSGRKK